VDLTEIERYSVKEWGRKSADKCLDDIQSALDRLKEDPDILRLETDLAPGLYFYRVGKHFLVCDYPGDMIVVLTVTHTSMDIPARLTELEPRLESEVRLLRQRCHGDAKLN
jgi:plasmid stabilization system protein ParE